MEPDPLLFWKIQVIVFSLQAISDSSLFYKDASREHKSQLPKLALDLFRFPSTIIPSERLFSIGGLLSSTPRTLSFSPPRPPRELWPEIFRIMEEIEQFPSKSRKESNLWIKNWSSSVQMRRKPVPNFTRVLLKKVLTLKGILMRKWKLLSKAKVKHDIVMKADSGKKQTGFFKSNKSKFPMFPCVEETIKYDNYGEIIRIEDFIMDTSDC